MVELYFHTIAMPTWKSKNPYKMKNKEHRKFVEILTKYIVSYFCQKDYFTSISTLLILPMPDDKSNWKFVQATFTAMDGHYLKSITALL